MPNEVSVGRHFAKTGDGIYVHGVEIHKTKECPEIATVRVAWER